jgi:hypothetical protein
MPKREKQPKDMTNEELAKKVFHPKVLRKLHKVVRSEDDKPKPKSQPQ